MAGEILDKRPHKHVTPFLGGAHQPFGWWHADRAARLAEPITADDLRRWSLELDSEEIWEITSTDPVAWRKVIDAKALSVLSSAPAAPLHLYVALSGADSNAGSAAAPLATLAAVWARLPAIVAGVVVVHLGHGVHVWTPPPAVLMRRDASIVIVGDGAAQGTDDGCTVLASGVATSGSTATTINTTGLSAGAYLGATLEITSGAAAGNRRGIVNTTATTIQTQVTMYDATGAAVNVAAGDSWRIIRPAASFTNPAPAVPLDLGRLARVCLIGVSVPAGVIGDGGQDETLWIGVELSGACSFDGVMRGGDMPATPYVDAIRAALGLARWSAWIGWGISSLNGSYLAPPAVDASAFVGYVYLDTGRVYPGMSILGGRAAGFSGYSGTVWFYGNMLLSAAQNCMLLDGTTVVYAPNTDLTLTDQRTGGYVAMSVSGQATAYLRNLIITPAASGGIGIDAGGALKLTAYGTITINGTTTAMRLGNDVAISGSAYVSTGSIIIQGTARLAFNSINSGPISMFGASKIHAMSWGATCSLLISGSAPGGGALSIDGPAQCTLGWRGGGYGSTSVQNTATAASSDGVRLRDGGTFCNNVANPTIGTAGSSGYGVNCRGGGRFTCPNQPTNVVGPTADFSVGTNLGDDFSDTELSASYAARVSGLSVVQRTA